MRTDLRATFDLYLTLPETYRFKLGLICQYDRVIAAGFISRGYVNQYHSVSEGILRKDIKTLKPYLELVVNKYGTDTDMGYVITKEPEQPPEITVFKSSKVQTDQSWLK